MMRTTLFLLFVATTALSLGCSDPATEIDESVDCNDICDRYRSCYDSDYDTAACRDRCGGLVDADGGRPRAANDCDTCLDDRSCVESTFSCNTECAGILP